jgi:hypothetical protein
MKASLLQPALWGGALAGVLSALPFVSAGNCCCCLWVVSGGVLAAYLLQQGQSAAIEVGDGALAGLLAGVFGAVVAAVLSVPVSLLAGPLQQQLAERWLQTLPNVPQEMHDIIESMRAGGLSGWGMAGGFFVMLIIGAVFSTIGGVVGAVIFRRGRSRAVPAGEAPPQSI